MVGPDFLEIYVQAQWRGGSDRVRLRKSSVGTPLPVPVAVLGNLAAVGAVGSTSKMPAARSRFHAGGQPDRRHSGRSANCPGGT